MFSREGKMSYYLHSVQNVTSYAGNTFSRDFTNSTKNANEKQVFYYEVVFYLPS